jgi:hypothetical protein
MGSKIENQLLLKRLKLPSKEDLIEGVKASLEKVYDQDLHLLEIDCDERSINHRLAFYLISIFEKERLKVDVEYNRHLKDLKVYEGNKYGSIDILIHERGSDLYNLCAFECKKEKLTETDLLKINALISPEFNYKYGITVEYNKRIITIHQVIDGIIRSEILEL